MNIEKLENDVNALLTKLNKDTFIYDLLLAYGLPKASITRLQKGDYNLAKVPGEILWKKKLFFKQETSKDLHQAIDQLCLDPVINKQHPRFIVISDFKSLLAVDTKTNDTLDIALADLAKHYDFFLPWAGMEKAKFQSENPADVKAAERMGRLYDLILEDNPAEEKQQIHALNIFLSRLLFCFFAEDTGIFQDNQFTNAIASHTAEDGSDLNSYLLKLFTVLNMRERADYAQFLQDFPYVNGGLFADEFPIPSFTAKSRKIIVECGTLNWKAINPDIFGSMIQAVVHNDQRSNMGMHYTSVVNIMKVIEPLFLNDLKGALEKAQDDEKKLINFLGRLYNLRLFDPACGSGNFLIIAYKELCQLEMEAFKQLQQINASNWKHAVSGLHLNQFYGIELDDFAHETAKLSLWLTEHQMNLAFKEVFGESRATLPLQDSGNITCGNATRLEWEVVCPKLDTKGEAFEVYILGNPPFQGSKGQTKQQKYDLDFVFERFKNYKKLDYVACWFKLASDYISNQNYKFSLVSTNSICQGEQVNLIWPYIFNNNLQINFAYQSFDWNNNAKHNAGITCVIVGVSSDNKNKKYIFRGTSFKNAGNISPYLIEASNLSITPRISPLSSIPIMVRGSQPTDDGNLILYEEDKRKLLEQYPNAEKYIKYYMGADDFINSKRRYCLWIDDNEINQAKKITFINDRIKKCQLFREKSKKVATQKKSSVAYKFDEVKHQNGTSLLFPIITSYRRKYIPIGFFDEKTVISNKGQVIYNPTPFIFSILSSRMHVLWLSVTSSRMRNDFQYSSKLSYNTFPFPEITKAKKNTLEDCVFKVLDEREQHSEKTMAQLYDPDKMPQGLRLAHHEMDLAIEQCYRTKPFSSDEERLEYLFNLYEEMIAAEKRA